VILVSETEDFYASVPQELKELHNWVGWKLTETKDNKLTKLPYSSASTLASSTDPSGWRDFEEVCKIPPTKDKGVGFVFNGNGIIGIDLDHCLDENGNINEKFSDVVAQLDTYTEVSPSGTGLHLFVKCVTPPYDSGRKKDDFEIYSSGRYFTVTGQVWNGAPSTITEYPVDFIRELCNPFVNTPEFENKPTSFQPSLGLSDEDILGIISHSQNYQKFNLLWRGSISEYNNDRSSADMALASILAFYSTDVNQIERIMRQSGLMREKWDQHKKYLCEYTIQKAINGCKNHYVPTTNKDVNHGKEIMASLSSNKAVPIEEETQLTDSEIDSIKESLELCENLPPFPKITHPLFKQWIELGGKLMFSHKSYHFGNLLPIASMALGRRVAVLISTKYTYTNFNTMLVGTSTISGKSFSSDTAIEEFGIPTINIPTLLNPVDSSTLKRKSCSNQRLVQDMSKSHGMLWYYDEAKEFFDDCGERGWNAPIISNLCTAYDGSVLESTRSNKSGKNSEEDNKWVCSQPFLNLLFNMTINQLKDASTPKVIGSGFFYRWLWFLEKGGEKKKNVTATQEDLDGIAHIKEELIKVGTLMKTLRQNDICFNVNDKIEQWSMDISKVTDDENYQSATGRSFIHIYKLAMVFALFDHKFQKTIFNQDHYPIRVELPDKWVDEAIMIVEKYLLPRMLIVIEYSEKVDRNNKQQHILDNLRLFKGVAGHSELLKRTKLDRTDFAKAIATLEESEEIKSVIKGSKRIYYILPKK